MKPVVFIHTNDKQMIGAKASAHSFKRNSATPDAFDVKIIRKEDYDFFTNYADKPFLRTGAHRLWSDDDLQSFTPTRFMPPELMNYKGRALVTDPDVFAVGDVCELLSRDMQGKAIMCRQRPGHNKRQDYLATSVMLLDCTRLKHWNVQQNFDEMFRFERDYDDWITLASEPRDTIGLFEYEWNDFDRLAENTKLIHNTKRRTQPWKTGLPIDYTVRSKLFSLLPKSMARTMAKFVNEGRQPKGKYQQHPDPKQEAFFFTLVKECLENGTIADEELRAAMQNNHVRHDAYEVVSALKQKVAA